jgi:hypothetical protein
VQVESQGSAVWQSGTMAGVTWTNRGTFTVAPGATISSTDTQFLNYDYATFNTTVTFKEMSHYAGSIAASALSVDNFYWYGGGLLNGHYTVSTTSLLILVFSDSSGIFNLRCTDKNKKRASTTKYLSSATLVVEDELLIVDTLVLQDSTIINIPILHDIDKVKCS